MKAPCVGGPAIKAPCVGRCAMKAPFVGGPAIKAPCAWVVVVEVLLYVHRNRRLIRDGSPGRPPRHSHSS